MKRIVVSAEWCKNCPVVKANLDATGLEYSTVDADTEEGIDTVKQYGIRGLPTVLLLDDNGTEIRRLVGVQPVSAYK